MLTSGFVEEHSQPEPNTGCWLWTGLLDKAGYARVRSGGLAYRKSYEAFVGPIPEGMTIDHRCNVRSCVSPDHLRPMTLRENILRSETHVAARYARRTHCARGHRLGGKNKLPWKRGRACWTCQRETGREWARRRRAQC